MWYNDSTCDGQTYARLASSNGCRHNTRFPGDGGGSSHLCMRSRRARPKTTRKIYSPMLRSACFVLIVPTLTTKVHNLLKEHCHVTVPSLSRYCIITVTLLYQQCHAIVLSPSRYCSITITLLYYNRHAIIASP